MSNSFLLLATTLLGSTSPCLLPPGVARSVNRVMEIVQGIVSGVDAVIRQAGAMLKGYFPL